MIPEEDAVTFAGGDGRTMATAVVILGAPDSMVAVEAEYGFLARRFGARDVDWGLKGQHLQEGEDGRMFDVMNVVLAGGSREVVPIAPPDLRCQCQTCACEQQGERKNSPTPSPSSLQQLLLVLRVKAAFAAGEQ